MAMNKLTRINHSELNPDWMAGFIDAEGGFRVNIYPNEIKSLRVSISFTFHISQKEDLILERVKAY